MEKAVNLAVDHINSDGGPLERDLSIENRDSERRPEVGVESYETLVSEYDIIGFVGAASSKVSLPIAREVGGDQVMQVSCLSASPRLSMIGYHDGTKYFARTVAPSNSQAHYYTPEGMMDPKLWSDHEKGTEGFYASADVPKDTVGFKRFQSAMGPDTPPFSPHAYDAMFLIALAIERAESATGTAIANNIRDVSRPPGTSITVNEFKKGADLLREGESINYEGASGEIDLNEYLEPIPDAM